MLRRICILDGDTRNSELVNLFIQKGIDSRGYYSDMKDESIKEYVSKAQAVVLPLNSAYYDLPWIKFEEICPYLEKGTMIFAGKPDNGLLILTEKHDLIVNYFLNDETFLIKNSFITAEGAIASAIYNSSGSLINSKSVIIGSGRIAAALFCFLKAFTPNVQMVSRNTERLSLFSMHGCSVCQFDMLRAALSGAEYVFNTVPARVLNREALEQMSINSLYIELASPPYGCEMADVPSHIRYILVSGIPGKVSPVAAAAAMMEFIIREMEANG